MPAVSIPSRTVLLIAPVQREYLLRRLTPLPSIARIARSVPETIKRFPLSLAVALILPDPSKERTARSVADVINI